MKRILIIPLFFMVFRLMGQDTSIVAMEYYVDLDPGYGQATAIDMSAGLNINEVFSITTGELTFGYHKVYVRVQNANGNWGLPIHRLFEVSARNPNVITFIEGFEYFFDEDPGYGNGTFVNSVTPDEIINQLAQIGTDTISQGFHNVFIRARDDAGNWGITERRLVFVDNPNLSDTLQIVGLEYFFDADPGHGNATLINVNTPQIVVDINQIIATDTVSLGFHKLFFRAIDESGRYGLVESKLVFVDNSAEGSVFLVDGLEYFFNTDPGYGNGTFLAANTPAEIVDFIHQIETDTLAVGFHILYLRARDTGGRWGLVESKLVYVDESSSNSVSLIEGIEYFFDSDPGYGEGAFIQAGSFNPTVDFIENLSTDTVSTGFHILYIRAKNTTGQWGLVESRLVYLDHSSENSVANVDGLEYFFDEDPGYGSANFVANPTPSSIMNITEMISTDGISNGFHKLYIRPHTDNGTWGLAESRVIYIDSLIANNTILIDRFEYFIDADPGYGLATQIPVTANSPNVLKFNVNLSTTSVGDPHVIGFRAKDQNGTWSLTQTFQFKIYSESAELDSVSLVKFYQGAGGTAWTLKTNWLSGKIDTWFGITVDPISKRVLTIDLSANNLNGKVAREFGFITQVTNVDLANNQLKDSIPETVGLHYKALQSLDLRNNQLNGLPNLSGITTLQTLMLENNQFTFEDLTANVFPTTFSYNPQAPVLQGFDSVINIRQSVSIIANVGGVSNTYQWFKDSVAINGAVGFTYVIPSVGVYDTASYYCEVKNALLPDLTISTNNYNFSFSESTMDSLSLVALYDSLGGDNWINKTGWKQEPIANWFGVEVFNGRVTGLSLPNNNLVGNIPITFLNCELMTNLNLLGNLITGVLPDQFKTLGALSVANLANNDITQLPNNIRATVPGLNTLNVEGNRLQFGSLESNLSVPTFSYIPQDSILVDDTEIIINLNDPITFSSAPSGLNNQYQWIKNGQPVAGAQSNSLNFGAAQFEDEGFYQLRVTNFIVPNLTLYTQNVYLIVSGLRRDSLALVAMYDSTNGDGWSNKSGWKTAPIQTWHGVNVSNDRVREVILPANNLTGILPPNLKHLTALAVLNLNDNKIHSMPDLTSLTELNLLDVSKNKLQFAVLEPNRSIAGLVYAPQDSIGEGLLDTSPVGSNYLFSLLATGSQNNYQWFKGSTEINGANGTDYTIENLSFDNMGQYFLKVSNPLLPSLTLTSKGFTVFATANIGGKVLDVITEVTSGEVYLFKVKNNKYDSSGFVSIQSNGDYLFENIVLDDYVILAKPNETNFPDLLPSYLGNTIDWEDATTLTLRLNELERNITLEVKPGASEGRGTILGFMEEEVEGGRLLARARVSGAGVSVRRVSDQGRGLGINGALAQELVLYLQTDENGEFIFPNVPKDKYFIKFDYPGIPMDLNSDVNLEMRGFVDEIIEVEAIVDGGEIVVTKVRQTGIADAVNHQLNVYPNPTKGLLNIALPEPSQFYQLQVTDLVGKSVLEMDLDPAKTSSGSFLLNLDNVEAGTYLVSIVTEDAKTYLARVFVE